MKMEAAGKAGYFVTMGLLTLRVKMLAVII